jgi:HlyD family secretion protein
LQAEINDSSLKSPRDGRLQSRAAQPGEVVPAGGKVLSILDVNDVTMAFVLPTAVARQVAIGSEARLVLDAMPHSVIPAGVSSITDSGHFMTTSVETPGEREQPMRQVKARIAPEVLKAHIRNLKNGLSGVAYVRLDPRLDWPAELQVKLPP